MVEMKKLPVDLHASTISSVFVTEMLQGAATQGVDIKHLLPENAISAEMLKLPLSRVTFTQLSGLSRSLAQVLEDEVFGLTHRPQLPGTYSLLCNCLINATSVRESIETYRDFVRILDNSFNVSLTQSDGKTVLTLNRIPGRSVLNNYAIEHFLLTFFRTVCWLADTQIPLVSVGLDYEKPPHGNEYGLIFYGTPVQFSQSKISLEFLDKSLDLPNVRTRKDLEAFLQATSLKLLSQTYKSSNYSTRLRLWISKMLVREGQAPSIESAADHFCIHPQALRRKLSREGSSYHDIKTDTRRDMAINLISHGSDSIESIAFQLGFSESRAFIRAFKAWTGMTPLAFRKMNTRETKLLEAVEAR